MSVAWEDAPAQVTRIVLGRAHDRLAVSPADRFAFAFGGGREVSVVDLGRGRVVQVIGSASPVAEIAFLSDAAVMRTGDGTLAGVMDLRLIKPGAVPVLGQFALGAGPPPTPGAALLAPLLPETPAARLPGTIQPEPGPSDTRLRLSDGAGHPFAQGRGHLLVISLVDNWRDRMVFETDSDGRTPACYQLPASPLAIVIETGAGRFQPLIME